MASYNKVILAGNLTRDPQLSHTASNTAVCKFGIATNRKWRDKQSGEMREDVCFVDCTAFGKAGEVINQYMGKGRSILIDGRLQYSKWEGQDGGTRSKLEVVVENFQFLGGGRGEGGDGPPRRQQGGQSRDSGGQGGGSQSGGYDDGGYDDSSGYSQGAAVDEDVPF